MVSEKVYFDNSFGRRLCGRIYGDPKTARSGVIYSHGLFSTKDGYKIKNLAGDIAQAGFALLAFDFSFSGESGNDIRNISVAQEVDDLSRACAFFDGLGVKRLHLVGSSMGGVVTSVYASDVHGAAGLRSLTLIATPVMYDKIVAGSFSVPDADSLPKNGQRELDGNMINNAFFLEFAKMDGRGIMGSLKTPALIIHGELDDEVPVENALLARDIITPEKKLVIIPGGSHDLADDRCLAIIRENLIDWLVSHD